MFAATVTGRVLLGLALLPETGAVVRAYIFNIYLAQRKPSGSFPRVPIPFFFLNVFCFCLFLFWFFLGFFFFLAFRIYSLIVLFYF